MRPASAWAVAALSVFSATLISLPAEASSRPGIGARGFARPGLVRPHGVVRHAARPSRLARGHNHHHRRIGHKHGLGWPVYLDEPRYLVPPLVFHDERPAPRSYVLAAPSVLELPVLVGIPPAPVAAPAILVVEEGGRVRRVRKGRIPRTLK